MGLTKNLGWLSKYITADSVGNIGIGTPTPGTASANTILGFVNGSNIQARTSVPQIAMSANIDGDWYAPTYKTSNFASQIFIDGNAGAIGLRTAASGTAGGTIAWNNGLRMDSSGNVGIGTTSPAAKLEINGSGGYGVRIGEGGEVINGCSSSGYSGLYLQHTGNSNNLLLVNGGGKVGIGTTSPTTKLDVNGTFRAQSASTTAANNFLNGVYVGRGGNANNYNGICFEGVASTDMYLGGAIGSDSLVVRNNTSELMRITSSGNVGIGTTTDSGYKLNVNGANQYLGRFDTSDTTGGFVSFAKSNTAYGYLGVAYHIVGGGSANDLAVSSVSNLVFASGSSLSERMRITSGGTVAIGTTLSAPTGLETGWWLAQQGRAYFSSSANSLTCNRYGSTGTIISFDYNGSAAGGNISTNGSSISYNTSSDYRLKQDLKPINGLDLVSQIKVYDYEWKSDESRSYGVLAHELQEVIPQAVTGEKDAENMQGVDYSKLVPILVQAIQELTERIKTLENK